MNAEDLVTSIAALKEQLLHVAANVADVKATVEKLGSLDRALTELLIHNQHTQEKISTIWRKIDESFLAAKRNDDKSEAVDRKVEALSNRGRGAMWVLGILMGTFQALMMTAALWIFNHVNDADGTNKMQQQQIESIEFRLRKLTGN